MESLPEELKEALPGEEEKVVDDLVSIEDEGEKTQRLNEIEEKQFSTTGGRAQLLEPKTSDPTDFIPTQTNVAEDTPPVKHRANVVIRCKPLGAGAGDKIHKLDGDKWCKKRIKDIDTKNNNITFGEEGGDAKRNKVYKCPTLVAPGEAQ